MTDIFNSPDVQIELRRLRSQHAGPRQYLDLITSHADPDAAAGIRAEFDELPASTMMAFVEGWALADASGMPFEIASERPARPIEFAKARRVTVAIEAEEHLVRVVVSHVASRHAAWYRPTFASA